MKKSHNHLFIDILEIGMKHINTGISYNNLKVELEEKGYVFDNSPNSCKESTIENWFWDNFSHCDCKLAEDVKEKLDENDTLNADEHPNCGCIIKGEACLTYLNFINSEKSKTYCFIAIICTIIIAIFSISTTLFCHLDNRQRTSDNKIECSCYNQQKCSPQTINNTTNQDND